MSDGGRPMDGIRADDTAVKSVLSEMTRLLLACGTRLHPGIVLVESERHFTVHCDASAGATGELLFHLPRELLVPTDDAVWSDRTDRMELVRPPPALTAVQRELLDMHVELFNAAGKLPAYWHQHPRRAVWDHASVHQAMDAVRPGAGWRPSNPTEGFLATRTYGLPGPGGRRLERLMPLIDLLNHHYRGYPYAVDDTAMTIEIAQGNGDAECFAHYGGLRDVLELALRYGYLDRSTPFAYSAPLDIEVRGIGRVVVLGERPRPLHALDPPRLQFEDARLVLSHLCCDLEHPERVRIVLQLALQAAAQQRGLSGSAAERASADAYAEIAHHNLQRLAALAAACDAVVTQTPSAALLAAAARRQAAIMSEVFGAAP